MPPSTSNTAEAVALQHTPLHALHVSHHAKMVPFAGYEMPLQYAHGIKHEHNHTRRAAGLFDVSHMGQIRLSGGRADAALEGLVTGDITGLKEHRLRYTLLTDAQGGIIDDLMVTKLPEGLFMVVNAARKDVDITHIQAALGDEYPAELLLDRGLLALQGPGAAAVLEELAPGITELRFMQAADCRINGIPCLVSRSGYTGEDGFEISLPAERAESLAERLLEHPDVAPVGLGARDSLRLEAGLCLYGHDLDETTTPVEADLEWVIAGKYRRGEAPAHFPGADRILEQITTGPPRRRVGLQPEGKVLLREGTPLLNDNNDAVGRVTSGGFGPTVDAPVAMGYVDTRYTEIDTLLRAEIRERRHGVYVKKLPFIETRYHKN